MGRLPTGPVSPHMKMSHDGESYMMKFYCTQRETSYGSHWTGMEPRIGQHKGAGYVPNNRPPVQYTPLLDAIDNPGMGRVIAKNYLSQTHKHFVQYDRPYGKETLPQSAFHAPTGFLREKGTHNLRPSEVRNQFFDLRMKENPSNLAPKHSPLLHNIQPKDPYANENTGYGPKYMSTEYTTKYKGLWPEGVNLATKSLGPKEQSGFVSNSKLRSTITDTPNSNHRNDRPGWMTDRPTGRTMYKTTFVPLTYKHGKEPLPNLPGRTVEDSGCNKGNKATPDFVIKHPEGVYDKLVDMSSPRREKLKKEDPVEYLNAIHPDNHSSVYKDTYLGHQWPLPTEADRLGRTDVGNKEETGHTSNEKGHVHTRDNPARFITHHMTVFHDPTPNGADREGHLCFEVDPVRSDGFTKSIAIHQIEPQIDAFRMLRRLDPYQARSYCYREAISTAPPYVTT